MELSVQRRLADAENFRGAQLIAEKKQSALGIRHSAKAGKAKADGGEDRALFDLGERTRFRLPATSFQRYINRRVLRPTAGLRMTTGRGHTNHRVLRPTEGLRMTTGRGE